MLASLLLISLAAPAPLTVRVLEKERPADAWVEAGSLKCDGEKLKSASAKVSLKERRLSVATSMCDALLAEGTVKLVLDGKNHTYKGSVTVTAEGAQLRFVNEVEVEDYLPSVVSIEAGDMPAAALDAQAVVSRTFALASRHRHEQQGYDLCDLAHCQAYRGAEEVSVVADTSVKRTHGEVLLLGGVGLKPTFFHAACGGHTSRPVDVFGEEGSGPGVSDVAKDGPLCKDTADFNWSFETSRVEMAHALAGPVDGVPFEPLRRDAAGRVVELRSFGRRFKGTEFMSAMGRAFGWQTIRSMKLTVQEVEGTVMFKGTGIGHGVGLCQNGAKAMATRGATAKQILQKYFPDCQVRVP